MKLKATYLPCECVGGKRECGYIGIVNFDGGIEIFFTKYKRKKANIGVYIQSKKSLKILRDLIK